jgi:hypothetical protein
MAKSPASDTKGKPVPADAIPMHKRLAMGQSVDTGGKSSDKSVPKTPA